MSRSCWKRLKNPRTKICAFASILRAGVVEPEPFLGSGMGRPVWLLVEAF